MNVAGIRKYIIILVNANAFVSKFWICSPTRDLHDRFTVYMTHLGALDTLAFHCEDPNVTHCASLLPLSVVLKLN